VKRFSRALLYWLALSAFVLISVAEEALLNREWRIDGVKREALVHPPQRASGQRAPVIFVFHGHGGSMRQAAKSMPFHEQWPEAMVIYLQGLPTPGRLTDKEGKRDGWQAGPGELGDRDLKFFDAMWRSLNTDYALDAKRVYATGHSNGGSFTYLLWAKRAHLFAAFGPSGAVAGRSYGPLAPRPVIHIAGEQDELVKFSWQKLMIESLRRSNQCGPGRAVGENRTLYDSKVGAPVMTYLYPGSHTYPVEATALIVAFFKTHAKP
jgi:polyhydroxybutyrate depolymerase